METKGFSQFETTINVLVSSDSDVYRRRILTFKVVHRAERVKIHIEYCCIFAS